MLRMPVGFIEGSLKLSADLSHSLSAPGGLMVLFFLVGFALGGSFASVLGRYTRLVTPADPLLGMIRYMTVNFLGMILVLGSLIVVFVFIRTAVAPFGVGLVLGFVMLAVVHFLRSVGPLRISD